MDTIYLAEGLHDIVAYIRLPSDDGSVRHHLLPEEDEALRMQGGKPDGYTFFSAAVPSLEEMSIFSRKNNLPMQVHYLYQLCRAYESRRKRIPYWGYAAILILMYDTTKETLQPEILVSLEKEVEWARYDKRSLHLIPLREVADLYLELLPSAAQRAIDAEEIVL